MDVFFFVRDFEYLWGKIWIEANFHPSKIWQGIEVFFDNLRIFAGYILFDLCKVEFLQKLGFDMYLKLNFTSIFIFSGT